MDEFCGKIAEILEVDTIGPDDKFREAGEYWDSMMGFSILVMIDNDYNVHLEENEFLDCKTVRDLFDRISA